MVPYMVEEVNEPGVYTSSAITPKRIQNS
jgi:hypothetical protein